MHESFVSISCEIVGEAFARSVISEVHAPGNDGIQFYSVAFGRRNSLQEGFFDKLNRRPAVTGCGPSVLYFTLVRLCFYATQARSFHRKVTIWPRVQGASGLKAFAPVPAVMFSDTAQRTASA